MTDPSRHNDRFERDEEEPTLRGDSGLTPPDKSDIDRDPDPATTEGSGQWIGPYRLRSRIGEGGMGTVWLAEQTSPVRREVALKVIKAGMDSKQVIGRFETERQALALMNHGNIARVLDAGTTEQGRPYFVMELVRGVPFDDYCDDHRLSTAERLRLFVSICRAVQHAHQKGIIHRDIKPSNVLITVESGRAVPKVIDFGLAKAMQARLTGQTVDTLAGQALGTLQYMSPEQSRVNELDIDSRSDIYSLGVMLYELLTGTTPIDKATLHSRPVDQVLHQIRENDPPRPSRRLSESSESAQQVCASRGCHPKEHQRQLRGELDWIVMKAIEKDRTRRYETASELAQDIERFLDGKTVLARPPSRSYQLTKFLRRNRGAVSAAAAALLVLVGGLVTTSWALRWALKEQAAAKSSAEEADAERKKVVDLLERTTEAEQQASQRAQELEKISRFQQKQLAQIGPAKMGDQLRESILKAWRRGNDRMSQQQKAEFAEQLDLLNFTNLAIESLNGNFFAPTEKAINSEFRDQARVRGDLLHSLGDVVTNAGMTRKGAELKQQALELMRGEFPADHPKIVWHIASAAEGLLEIGELKKARELLNEAMHISFEQDAERSDHPVSLRVLHNRGRLEYEARQFADAEAYFRDAWENRTRVLGPDHHDTIDSEAAMGLTLRQLGRLDEAEELLLAVYRKATRVLGAKHARVGTISNYLGQLYADLRNSDKEIEYLSQGLELQRNQLGDNHPATLSLMNNFALALGRAGRTEESGRTYADLLPRMKKLLGSSHRMTMTALANYAYHLNSQGKDEQAAPIQQDLLLTQIELFGEDDPRIVTNMNNLAITRQKLGQLDEAERLLRKVIAIQRKSVGDDHMHTMFSVGTLGGVLMEQGRYSEAEPLLREPVDTMRRTLGSRHPETLISIASLGFLLRQTGNDEEAGNIYEELISLSSDVHGPESSQKLDAEANLGIVRYRQNRLDEAGKLLNSSHQKAPKVWKGVALLRTRTASGSDSDSVFELALKLEKLARQKQQGNKLAISLSDIGEQLISIDRFEPAHALIQEALDLYEEERDNDWRPAHFSGLLGAALSGLEKTDESEKLLLSSYEQLAALGTEIRLPYRHVVQDAIDRLVKFYERNDRDDEAARWRKQKSDTFQLKTSN